MAWELDPLEIMALLTHHAHAFSTQASRPRGVQSLKALSLHVARDNFAKLPDVSRLPPDLLEQVLRGMELTLPMIRILVAEHGTLTELTIGSDAQDRWLNVIGQLRHLRKLTIVSADRLTAKAARHLAKTCGNTLTHLEVRRSSLQDQFFKGLTSMKALCSLRVSDMWRLSHFGLQSLPQSIEVLTVEHCSRVNQHMWGKIVTSLPRLRILRIDRCCLGQGLDFGKHARLELFSAKNAYLTAIPEALKKLPQLAVLELPKNQQLDLTHLAGLNRLRVLNLSHSAAGDKVAEILRDHPCLAELDLTSTRLTDSAIPNLLTIKSLATLLLAYNNLSDDGAKQLLALPPLCGLQTVDVHGNVNIGEEVLKELEERWQPRDA